MGRLEGILLPVRIAGWPTRCKKPGPYDRESADRFDESPSRGFQYNEPWKSKLQQLAATKKSDGR